MQLAHKCCPSCGSRVPWKRLWLKAWIWARWPCAECGAKLQFNRTRRVVAAVASTTVGYVIVFPALLLILFAEMFDIPTLLAWTTSIAVSLVAIGVMIFLAWLIDGVQLDTREPKVDVNN